MRAAERREMRELIAAGSGACRADPRGRTVLPGPLRSTFRQQRWAEPGFDPL